MSQLEVDKVREGGLPMYFPPSPRSEPSNPEDDSSREAESVDETTTGDLKQEVTNYGIITPDHTPTKDNEKKSSRAGTKKSPAVSDALKSIVNGKTSPEPNKLSSSVDSPTVDSPKPSKAKQSKSDETGTTSARGRKGRGRKKANSTSTVSNKSQATKSTAKSTTVNETRNKNGTNTLVTDYFPVRRSSRKTSEDVKKEKQTHLEKCVLNKVEHGLKVVEFEGKGRGVVATKPFKRGDFVVEYYGELLEVGTAKEKEEEYSANLELGCYMYYFNYNNKKYCVDATAESGRLGRLLNHSRSGNCCTKVIGMGNRPYLLLVAAKDITKGEELLYDYGDRSKSSLEAHPWLAY